ncbi:hypothetical protein [Rubrolithibacter danxiaensis]|uniref:hypothetical protein n=1 Tax=Rubrolithibacter danxiaensis TaxID=3390805 RepID=UPI003BF86C64
MKVLLSILIILPLFISCNQSPNYKSVRDDVVAIHDKVMIDYELAYRNKRKLDTLAKNLDTLKNQHDINIRNKKKEISDLTAQLVHADDLMNDWMHKFDAELGNKTNDEAVAYFNAEKLKIQSIDTLYKQVLKRSNEYLSSEEK